jgi:hypothetical protein
MKAIVNQISIIILFNLTLCGTLAAQQPNQVKPQLMRIIPHGTGPTELGFQNRLGSEPYGPEAITADTDSGWFYAWDFVNDRAVRFDAGRRIEIIPDARPFATFLSITPDGRLIAQDRWIARVFSFEQSGLKQLMEVLPQDYPIKPRSHFYFLSVGNLIIGEYSEAHSGPTGYEVFSIEFPVGKPSVFRAHDETLRFVRSSQTHGRGLWADEKGYLWVDERLFTFSGETFINYWISRSGKELNYSAQEVNRVGGSLLAGLDMQGNYYWDVRFRETASKLFVFDKNGKLITQFDYHHDPDRRSRLAVDQGGNVFFLQHKESGHHFYMIPNTWSPGKQISSSSSQPSGAPQLAVSTESRVRVRSAGNLQGDTLGYLEKGERVEVLEQSKEKMKIDTMNEYWFRIRRQPDGLSGWAYGGFLKLE